MIILAIFILYCIYFYRLYLNYGTKIVILFPIFCLVYFWLIQLLEDELNKQDKEMYEG